jgi:hypothetical protein
MRQGVPDLGGPVDDQGQREQGQRDDDRRPDGEAETRRHAGLAGHDVAARPGDGAGGRQQDPEQRSAGRAAERHHDEPGRADDDADQLRPGRALTEPHAREEHREHHLCLHDQAGRPGRQADRQGGVEQPELADAEQQPDQRDRAPRQRRARHQEHRREKHGDEPERHEQQRRHARQPFVDDGEVRSPQNGDEDGEQGGRERHAADSAWGDH